MKVWKQTKIIISIVALIILIALVYIANLDTKKMGVAGNVSTKIASPIFKLNQKIALNKQAKQQNMNIDDLIAENDLLRQENESLRLSNNELDAVKADNLELAELLGLRESYSNYEGVPAQVIAKNMSNFEKSVNINVGKDHDIKEDMIVVASKGLYGRVSEVYDNTAKVQLITDPSSNVTVKVGNSPISVIAKGNLENGLILTMFPLDYRLVSDEYIYTSGVGGIFPAGIYVGTVGDIKYKANESNSYATVKQAVDYESVNNVLVLKK